MAPGGLVEVRVSWPGHPRYLIYIYIYILHEIEVINLYYLIKFEVHKNP